MVRGVCANQKDIKTGYIDNISDDLLQGLASFSSLKLVGYGLGVAPSEVAVANEGS